MRLKLISAALAVLIALSGAVGATIAYLFDTELAGLTLSAASLSLSLSRTDEGCIPPVMRVTATNTGTVSADLWLGDIYRQQNATAESQLSQRFGGSISDCFKDVTVEVTYNEISSSFYIQDLDSLPAPILLASGIIPGDSAAVTIRQNAGSVITLGAPEEKTAILKESEPEPLMPVPENTSGEEDAREENISETALIPSEASDLEPPQQISTVPDEDTTERVTDSGQTDEEPSVQEENTLSSMDTIEIETQPSIQPPEEWDAQNLDESVFEVTSSAQEPSDEAEYIPSPMTQPESEPTPAPEGGGTPEGLSEPIFQAPAEEQPEEQPEQQSEKPPTQEDAEPASPTEQSSPSLDEVEGGGAEPESVSGPIIEGYYETNSVYVPYVFVFYTVRGTLSSAPELAGFTVIKLFNIFKQVERKDTAKAVSDETADDEPSTQAPAPTTQAPTWQVSSEGEEESEASAPPVIPSPPQLSVEQEQNSDKPVQSSEKQEQSSGEPEGQGEELSQTSDRQDSAEYSEAETESAVDDPVQEQPEVGQSDEDDGREPTLDVSGPAESGDEA